MASQEPLVVTAAEARVEKDVRLDIRAPAEIKVAAGRDLHVNFVYRYDESSNEREEYRFRLVSSVGEQRPAPVEARFGDTPLVTDSRQGYVGHRYNFEQPGTYEGKVEVEVERGTRAWGGGARTETQRMRKEATVRVVVL